MKVEESFHNCMLQVQAEWIGKYMYFESYPGNPIYTTWQSPKLPHIKHVHVLKIKTTNIGEKGEGVEYLNNRYYTHDTRLLAVTYNIHKSKSIMKYAWFMYMHVS